MEVVQRLEDTTVRTIVRGLQQETGFEFDDLKQLFLVFREECLAKTYWGTNSQSLQDCSSSQAQYEQYQIDFEQYRSLFRQLSPWWCGVQCDKLARKIFQMNKNSQTDQINFKDFAVTLGAICNGDPQKKLTLLYKLHLLPPSCNDDDDDDDVVATPTSPTNSQISLTSEAVGSDVGSSSTAEESSSTGHVPSTESSSKTTPHFEEAEEGATPDVEEEEKKQPPGGDAEQEEDGGEVFLAEKAVEDHYSVVQKLNEVKIKDDQQQEDDVIEDSTPPLVVKDYHYYLKKYSKERSGQTDSVKDLPHINQAQFIQLCKTLYNMFREDPSEQALYHSIATVANLLLQMGEVGKQFKKPQGSTTSINPTVANNPAEEATTVEKTQEATPATTVETEEATAKQNTEGERMGSPTSSITSNSSSYCILSENASPQPSDADVATDKSKLTLPVATTDDVTKPHHKTSQSSSNLDADWSVSFEQFLASVLTESPLCEFFERKHRLTDALQRMHNSPRPHVFQHQTSVKSVTSPDHD